MSYGYKQGLYKLHKSVLEYSTDSLIGSRVVAVNTYSIPHLMPLCTITYTSPSYRPPTKTKKYKQLNKS